MTPVSPTPDGLCLCPWELPPLWDGMCGCKGQERSCRGAFSPAIPGDSLKQEPCTHLWALHGAGDTGCSPCVSPLWDRQCHPCTDRLVESTGSAQASTALPGGSSQVSCPGDALARLLPGFDPNPCSGQTCQALITDASWFCTGLVKYLQPTPL